LGSLPPIQPSCPRPS